MKYRYVLSSVSLVFCVMSPSAHTHWGLDRLMTRMIMHFMNAWMAIKGAHWIDWCVSLLQHLLRLVDTQMRHGSVHSYLMRIFFSCIQLQLLLCFFSFLYISLTIVLLHDVCSRPFLDVYIFLDCISLNSVYGVVYNVHFSMEFNRVQNVQCERVNECVPVGVSNDACPIEGG